jgi:uncharacterized membrane protein
MGDAVLDVSAAANEPCVTVMLPTSPALFTVKPVMIPRSQTHDVNLTIDQALQFIISCGVVLPQSQLATVPAANTVVPAANIIDAETVRPSGIADSTEKPKPFPNTRQLD